MPIRLMAQEVYSNPYDFTKTISLSSRIVGIAVGSVLELVWGLVVLPVRIVEKVI